MLAPVPAAHSQTVAVKDRPTEVQVQRLSRLFQLDKLLGASNAPLRRQLVTALAQEAPNATNADLADARAAIEAELAVPLYQENLTAEEVRGLIRFYKSPVGQSVITKLPRLTQQGQQIGALVGEKLAKEAFEKSRKHLRQKGYQL